ncbi:cyclic nucleotide-binding domain protein (macronuclear) [Tetrahymena thermophila SB210]|uniref:Cyclic nucleotide-binding domain protein n=1 Tax=Tetrahymena thermophila (strain SB210) TaxID=312017 RepID=I7M955_TETTS|nr:cyclic nucleotide-binding domain protein [Tetrahymena thermophila SB210]EAS00821.2 cyclic nucleotide-binding domain protein [Tetrahymena thermophila SB210]|eukprot:XP_001021066.2 cyclic nucleotide-binding domain protein [Tetrahymena thermophila SB210]
MKGIKKNQVMPRAPSLSKLKRSSATHDLAPVSRNLEDEEISSNEEEGLVRNNKSLISQREEKQNQTQKKVEFEEDLNKINENCNESEKLILGETKSIGGSLLIFDKISQKSRNIKIQRSISKMHNSHIEEAYQDSRSLDNHAASSSFNIEQKKALLLQQNSAAVSENLLSSKDNDNNNNNNNHAVSMSLLSAQNLNPLLSPVGIKSSTNVLNNNQQKSHFASLFNAHKSNISKSGTIIPFGTKDTNNLIRSSNTKDGLVKFMSTMQSQPSILKKKKTLSEKSQGGWNVLGKVLIILRFMKQLKRSSIYYNFHNLKLMHYQMIGDKANIDKDEKDRLRNNTILNKCQKFIIPVMKKFSSAIKVYQPDNIWLLVFYDVIILGLTILTAFFELIISSFNGFQGYEIVTPGYQILRNVCGALYLIEILIRMNTAIYKEGIIIFSRESIFKNYSRIQYFWIDLIILISILIIFNNYILSLIFFVLRCIKISRLSQDLNDHFRIWYRFPTGWTLTKLFFMIIALAHFWGCQFHYIGRLEYESGMNSWMIKQQLIDDYWWIKYINSFYFTTISIVTIGYGDIAPVTTIEKLYCTSVAVLGSCFFSYIVNTIGSIFQEISNKEAAIKQQKNNISDYMAKRNINQKLQLKVIKYLDYTHSRQADGPLKGQMILNTIAKNLREEVQLEYFGNILQNTRIFKNNFSQDCLRALSLKLKEIMYGPGEVIFHKGELDYKIFFIQTGEVSLFLEKDGGEIFEMAKLSKGQYFGQFGFFGCKPREIAVKCRDITHLVYLENEDFISVIKNYQEDYEKYYMMKDEINFKDKKLSTKCSSCGSYDHTIVDCSLVTPHFNRFRIMIKYIYPVIQNRQALIRERNKFNSLQKNYNVRDDLKKVRNNLALKFLQSEEIDEVSDENEFSEEYDQIKQNQQMDDKEYFLKQKMQFRYVDGEIVNYESENTHNCMTDDNQSLVTDQQNQFGSQQTLQLRESGISQNDSVPEIVVQRKEQKQLSIIKNNYNPYLRQNSVVQKQSLFRMESLAALSSDINRDDAADVLSKGQGSTSQLPHTIAGGQYGQNYNQDQQNNFDTNTERSQNFYTQGPYENTSNVNSVNINATPRQAGGSSAIGSGYLTQQNIAAATNTVESTPQKQSFDQSLDENKNQSTAAQANQHSSEQKKLTHQQLQQVKEKLQMLNEKQKKNQKKSIPRTRKKQVSIQIQGKILDKEKSSSESYLEEEEDDDDGDVEQNVVKTKPFIHENFPNKDLIEEKLEINEQSSENIQEIKNSIQNIKISQFSSSPQNHKDSHLHHKNSNFNQDGQLNQNNIEDTIQQQQSQSSIQEKINKKLVSYQQGERILERKSEQSMYDVEASSLTLVNHQFLQNQKSNNTVNQSQNPQSNPSNTNILEEQKQSLKIDINSLQQYESSSSPSFQHKQYRNSNFFGFNKQNTGSEQHSQELEAVNYSPQPKISLDSPQNVENKVQTQEDNFKLSNSYHTNTEKSEIDIKNSPVKTPTHRRITIQAEKIFGNNIPFDTQESNQDDLGTCSQNKRNTDENENQDILLENYQFDKTDKLKQQQGSFKSKNNFLNIGLGELATVQEILTKNSQDDENTSPGQNNEDMRRFSSRSDQLKNNSPLLIQMKKSISQNPEKEEIKNHLNQKDYLLNRNNLQLINENSIEQSQITPKKANTVIINNNQAAKNDNVQSSYSSPINKNNQQNPLISNFIQKEGQQMNKIMRQNSLSFIPGNFNTNDMRKLIAYNRANSKQYFQMQDDQVQGAALYGINNYGQAPMNHINKQIQPLQAIKNRKMSSVQSQNQLNSPSHQVSSTKKNAAYPPVADSFSQQVMYHQKYIQNKQLLKSRNSIQVNQSFVNNQPLYDNNPNTTNGGYNTPKKKQSGIGTRFGKGQQFSSSTYGQVNSASNSNHTSFAHNSNNYNRARMTSWASVNNNNYNNNNMNNGQPKPDSQTNFPEDQYDEEMVEYESVSNADFFIYDFDSMKEYKKYYPQHNYKRVLTDCLRSRKPFISNKSIHNNPFIQKLMSKKKKIPRRLPSLMKQYDKDQKD